MFIQKFTELSSEMRTGDAFLFQSDGHWVMPDTVAIPALIRGVSRSPWSHIAIAVVYRLIERPNWKRDGGPPEMWVAYDTPLILKNTKKVWVQLLHATKHAGVHTELASIVLQNHKGTAAWIPMDHEKAYGLTQNYQSVIHALSLKTDGLQYARNNLFRYIRFLRYFWRQQLDAFTCVQCSASCYSACGFVVKRHSTPAELVDSGPFTRDAEGNVIGYMLVADESAKFRLYNKERK